MPRKLFATALAALLGSSLMLSGCGTAKKLKFWDKEPVFTAQKVEVRELRRALLCGTPTEAAVVRLFDNVEALRAWDADNKLQLGRIELPTDKAFVLLEQGLRQTGGYTVELRKQAQMDTTGTLRLQADWLEPAPDRLVTQIITSLCVLSTVDPLLYTRVEVVDGGGEIRAASDIVRD